jgi:hypothetical protein
MTDKNPDLEKLIPADLLPHSDASPAKPPGHDTILDLLSAEPPEVLSAPSPADVLTSAEPPAMFRPGNTGIMSPDPSFPGSASPNGPSPLGNPPQANSEIPDSDNLPPFVSPSVPGTDQSSTVPLSSLPVLDPALLSTLPFLSPPDESVPPTAGISAPSNQPPRDQFVPNSVRDILPLLPDATLHSSGDYAPRSQQPSGAGEPSRSTSAASASAAPAGARTSATWQAGSPPVLTINVGNGHRLARCLLSEMAHKLEDAAREQSDELRRSFNIFRANMRTNFR